MKNYLVVATTEIGLSIIIVNEKNKSNAMIKAKKHCKFNRFMPFIVKRVSKRYVETINDIRAMECPDEVLKEFE